MALPDWFDTDTAATALLGGLAVLAVLGLLVARFIRNLVLKFVVLAALIALGISMWAQRAELGDCARTCNCRLYGQDVVIGDDPLRQGCALRTGDALAALA